MICWHIPIIPLAISESDKPANASVIGHDAAKFSAANLAPPAVRVFEISIFFPTPQISCALKPEPIGSNPSQ